MVAENKNLHINNP